MATFRIYDWRPGDTPVATLRNRTTNPDTALTPTYTGTAVSGWSGVYEFDLGARSNGDYTVAVAGARSDGNYVIRIASTGVTVADNWLELDGSATLVTSIVDALDGAVTIVHVSPVAATGEITEPILIGDDYSDDRAFAWTVDEIDYFVAATSDCFFSGKKDDDNTWRVEGSMTDNGDGTWDLSFDLLSDDTASLEPGYYEWNVEVVNATGLTVTKVINDVSCRCQLRRKPV